MLLGGGLVRADFIRVVLLWTLTMLQTPPLLKPAPLIGEDSCSGVVSTIQIAGNTHPLPTVPESHQTDTVSFVGMQPFECIVS